MARLPYLSREDIPEHKRPVYDHIAETRSRVEKLKEMPRTYRLLLNSLDLGEHVARLGEYFRFESPLDAVIRETAIISTAREINSPYEWAHHEYVARQVGVRPEVIEAIRTRGNPAELSPDERVVIQVAQEMVHQRTVSEETFQTILTLLGPSQAVDLVALVAYYVMLGSVFNALGLELEDGLEPSLPA